MIRCCLLLLFLPCCFSGEELRPTIPPHQVLSVDTSAPSNAEGAWNPSLAQSNAAAAEPIPLDAELAGKGDVLDFVEAMRSFNGRSSSRGARPLGADSDGYGFSRPGGRPEGVSGRPSGGSGRPSGLGGRPSGLGGRPSGVGGPPDDQ
ncbi:MAG: hypothetical protein RL885_12905 [Planctomycetota bacterium]